MTMIDELRERHRNGPGYPSHLNGSQRGDLLDEIAALESKLDAARSELRQWAEAYDGTGAWPRETTRELLEPPK